MARVYTREGSDPVERLFLRVLGRDGAIDMDWKAYAKSVLVFSVVFSAFLYALLRLQGHLFLNPDHLKGVSWGVALNTTASFVTNTNWQYYGGEYTMSYLSQMAGLAVQNFVSAGVGMAVLVAVIRGIARRGGGEGLGNFWRDLYRSIAYVLLPLSIVLTLVLRLPGRRADVRRPCDRAHARGRDADDRARPGRVADRDQAARHQRRRLLQLELVGAVREPQRADQLLRAPLDPADPVRDGLHVRANGAGATSRIGARRDRLRDLRDRGGHRLPGRAARLGRAPRLRREHHAGPRAERRQPLRQGGPLRHRQHGALGNRDHRRLERLGRRRP